MSERWKEELAVRERVGTFGDPPLLHYRIDCPELLSGPAARAVNRFCTAGADALERRCCGGYLREARRQYAVQTERFAAFEITASVQIMRCADGLLSGFADCYRQLGTRGKPLTRLSRTFSLKNGAQWPLRALLRPGDEGRQRLLREVMAQMRRQELQQPGSFYPCTAERLAGLLGDHRYYLADDGLALWFPQGSIALPEAGIPTFLVRRELLRGALCVCI